MLTLSSPTLTESAPIPEEHTCDGRDRSPALEWSGAPEGTASFAVTLVDLDHPAGPAGHWLIYDLPADLERLPGSIAASLTPPLGGLQGRNDLKRIGYSGPCPPGGGGTRRYALRLRAVDVECCGAGPGATLPILERALDGHVLAEAAIHVTCTRPAR